MTELTWFFSVISKEIQSGRKKLASAAWHVSGPFAFHWRQWTDPEGQARALKPTVLQISRRQYTRNKTLSCCESCHLILWRTATSYSHCRLTDVHLFRHRPRRAHRRGTVRPEALPSFWRFRRLEEWRDPGERRRGRGGQPGSIDRLAASWPCQEEQLERYCPCTPLVSCWARGRGAKCSWSTSY